MKTKRKPIYWYCFEIQNTQTGEWEQCHWAWKTRRLLWQANTELIGNRNYRVCRLEVRPK